MTFKLLSFQKAKTVSFFFQKFLGKKIVTLTQTRIFFSGSRVVKHYPNSTRDTDWTKINK